MFRLERQVRLKEFTTIGLGGISKYFCSAENIAELLDAVRSARSMGLPFMILGGGSNVIFPDEGFNGVVIRNRIMGYEFQKSSDGILAIANSGEEWDMFVDHCVNQGLSGIECLSGIPGTVGATPIQNVGAYGQDVSQTIARVKAIDLNNFETAEFTVKDCDFGYRKSRFKSYDSGKYFISKVEFLLSDKDEPKLNYGGLNEELSAMYPNYRNAGRDEKLRIVREAVINIRKRKSMVITDEDPDSKSCGSFFLNPVLERSEFEKLNKVNGGILDNAPVFPEGDKIKISAAWLIETAGFEKGYTVNGAGISQSHSLALVNRGTTTKDLIQLADEIKVSVHQKFGIRLVPEPTIINFQMT